jgi:hypothetical protein
MGYGKSITVRYPAPVALGVPYFLAMFLTNQFFIVA